MHGVTPVGHFAQHLNNVQGSRKAEPYFCDRTLVQSLVRDAMVTDGLDRNSTVTSSGKEDKQYVSGEHAVRKHEISRSNIILIFSFYSAQCKRENYIDRNKRKHI